MLTYLLIGFILSKIAEWRLNYSNKDIDDSCIESLRKSHEFWKEYREKKMKKIKESSQKFWGKRGK